jgi:DNA-damage-inducible protein D
MYTHTGNAAIALVAGQLGEASMQDFWYTQVGTFSEPATGPTRMSEIALFHFDDGRTNFEDLGKPNGIRYWMESDLMRAMDYQTATSFRKVVQRAMQACLSLNISIEEHFVLSDREYKLTRFACYLIAMNGDNKKEQVAAAQVYFAALAETFLDYLQHVEGVDRCLVRTEMADGQKSLASTAKQHGVHNYPFFQNAGYRGMYNMDLTRLTTYKGLDPKSILLDRMGKAELAANLFRVTQTDEKIKKERVYGQVRLEKTAYDVGKAVRQTVLDLNGTAPEDIPIAPPIQQVRKVLKETSKKFKKLDGAKKKLPPKAVSDDQAGEQQR